MPETPGRGMSLTAPRRRHETQNEDEEGVYKRRRTALACNSCRYRKSRCNGRRPMCNTCAELGFECVYRRPAAAPQSAPARPNSTQLENRLAMVETLLQALVSSGGQPPEDMSDFLAADRDNDRLPMSSEPPDQVQPSINSGHDDTVDGMGVITFADEEKSGYFGPSSNSAFFTHIARALETNNNSYMHRDGIRRDINTSLSRPVSPPLPAQPVIHNNVNPYILPSRQETSRLIEVFFSMTGYFFPYIHRKTVLDMIEDLDDSGQRCVPKSHICLINALLAIGTSLDDNQNRPLRLREAESDIFFQRALNLSPGPISNSMNLESLQALCVMTQYLQGTSRSAQTWRIHGLLVQAAFQMGVHIRDQTQKLSPRMCEIRTRIWYTCIVIDRMLSMTFGRPPLIHKDYIALEPPNDVELDDLPDVDDGFMVPERAYRGSSTALFIASIDLYNVHFDILRDIYHFNVPSVPLNRPDKLVRNIIELDQDLVQWKTALPAALQLISVDDYKLINPESCAFSRSQVVLTIRYLNVHLLLYRSVLVACLGNSNPAEPESVQTLLPEMLKKCKESAVAMIHIVRAMAPQPEMLPAWWFTAYYVFNASLILFGLIVGKSLGRASLANVNDVSLPADLQTALDALEIVGRDTRIGRRCSKFLKKLIRVSSLLVRTSNSDIEPTAALSAVNFSSNSAQSAGTDDSLRSPFGSGDGGDFSLFLQDDDFENIINLDLWHNRPFQDFGAAEGLPDAHLT